MRKAGSAKNQPQITWLEMPVLTSELGQLENHQPSHSSVRLYWILKSHTLQHSPLTEYLSITSHAVGSCVNGNEGSWIST